MTRLPSTLRPPAITEPPQIPIPATLTRDVRTRDFDSQTQVLASNYQVLVAGEHLAKAQDVLSRPAPSE